MVLKVCQLFVQDVYKDMVRIPERHRRDALGRVVKESSICRITAEGRSILVSARGCADETEAIIRMDDKTRNALGVVAGREYDFQLEQVGALKQLAWAWDCSEPATRLAARLGLVSLALGVFGLLLGIASFVR